MPLFFKTRICQKSDTWVNDSSFKNAYIRNKLMMLFLLAGHYFNHCDYLLDLMWYMPHSIKLCQMMHRLDCQRFPIPVLWFWWIILTCWNLFSKFQRVLSVFCWRIVIFFKKLPENGIKDVQSPVCRDMYATETTSSSWSFPNSFTAHDSIFVTLAFLLNW